MRAHDWILRQVIPTGLLGALLLVSYRRLASHPDISLARGALVGIVGGYLFLASLRLFRNGGAARVLSLIIMLGTLPTVPAGLLRRYSFDLALGYALGFSMSLVIGVGLLSTYGSLDRRDSEQPPSDG